MRLNSLAKSVSIILITVLLSHVQWANAGNSAPIITGPNFVATDLTIMPSAYSDELVLNTPVAARISTKTVQKLYDGNQIIQIEETVMYRDSKGRIRREVSHADNLDFKSVSITNPREGGVTILNPATKVAFKTPGLSHMFNTDTLNGESIELDMLSSNGAVIIDSGVIEFDESLSISELSDLPMAGVMPLGSDVLSGHGIVAGGIAGFGDLSINHGQMHGIVRPEVTSLGQDKIGTIRVEGTRYTTTYPADAFGNVRPITVKREVWFSPELRMTLKSNIEDPRMGTISYSVELINREEPDQSLFEIPSDYHNMSVPGLPKTIE